MTNKRKQGAYFEEIVCCYLTKNGYKIIEKNFTIRGGEIDIIAQKNNTICFVEVKGTSLNMDFSYHITDKKKDSLIKTAQTWIINNHNKININEYRFDLIFVKNSQIIEHIKGFI